MLTLFSCPKPFLGEARSHQVNAIHSWTLLEQRPEIILLGDEEGTATIAKSFELRHVPEIERNECGTPLLESVFRLGQKHAHFQIVCYVNADIILLDDFGDAVKQVVAASGGNPFLLIGGRWNTDFVKANAIGEPGWEKELARRVKAEASLDREIAMDYFVFTKDIAWCIPPFALGRSSWDSWFPYRASLMRMPVIDATDTITAVHQQHGYQHFYRGERSLLHTPEGRRNLTLLGFGRRYTIADATHVLAPHGLYPVKRRRWKYLRNRFRELEIWVFYYLTGSLWPYSYPLYVLFKGLMMVRLGLSKVVSNVLARQKR